MLRIWLSAYFMKRLCSVHHCFIEQEKKGWSRFVVFFGSTSAPGLSYSYLSAFCFSCRRDLKPIPTTTEKCLVFFLVVFYYVHTESFVYVMFLEAVCLRFVSCDTDEKEHKIFLIYKEIQMGSGAKSYMRKGFLIYEEMHKYFHHIWGLEEVVSHIWLCTCSLWISQYMRKIFFSFLSV